MKNIQELIVKYNVSGPRYTSYPTALQFTDEFDQSTFIKAIAKPSDKNLSLYIHIPFCSNICYYCACNKVITKDSCRSVQYLDYLKKEIELIAKVISNKKIQQLHFGGGTPTFLENSQIESVLNELSKHFELVSKAELSIEIDPRTVQTGRLRELARMGFNRISIGVQDFNPKVQVAINRVQDEAQIEALLATARDLKISSINMDLIYGLPFQTAGSFAKTIERVIELKPDRISMFNYAHLPHRFKPQRRINEHDLPAASEKIAIFTHSLTQLTEAGYIFIGMDHFALPSDPLALAQNAGTLHRNFQGYTPHADSDTLALGVSGISNINNAYSQNHTTLDNYYSELDKGSLPIWRGYCSNHDDILRKEVIMSLICNFYLDIDAIEKRYQLVFFDYFDFEQSELKALSEQGLIEFSKNKIKVTKPGKLFIRNICMVFDKFLQEFSNISSYSKVI